MKAILFLVFLLLNCALGQDNVDIVVSWSGTTQNGPTFFAPNSIVPCFVVVNPSSYVVVNYTFATSGVREVVLLAEPSFKGIQQVFLYNTSFAPSNSATNANSCVNFERILVNQNFVGDAGIEAVDDPVYFQANTVYFFVITASTAGVGRFTLNILGSVATGTTVGGPIWTPSSLNTGVCANTTNNGGNIQQNLATFTWTQPSTGVFDILVMFEVLSSTNSVYFSLYKGNINTATIAAAPCLPPLNSDIYVTAQEGDPTTLALAQVLTINNVYTIAVSNIQASRWALQVRPTRLVRASSFGFPQPSRTFPPCTANATSANSGYVFVSFVAQFQTYFLDTYTIPSYLANNIPPYVSFSGYSFAYSGNNSAPSACPTSSNLIAAAPTGSAGPLVFSTTVGRTYNVFIALDSGASLNSSYAAQVFLFSGQTVGNTSSYIPDPTVTTTTTAISTTSTLTGTATGNSTTSTTGTSTTSTHTSSTSTSTAKGTSTSTSTSSDVATISFSAFLLLVGTIAALL